VYGQYSIYPAEKDELKVIFGSLFIQSYNMSISFTPDGADTTVTTYYQSTISKNFPIAWFATLISIFVLILIGASFNAYKRKKQRIQGELDLAYNMYKQLIDDAQGDVELDQDNKMAMLEYLKTVEYQVGS